MTHGSVLDADGIRFRVLIDGWRTVSPRFVFRDYDEAIHGPEVIPGLDADGKLPGRLAALLIEAPGGPILVDAGIGPFAGDLEAGLLGGELDALGVSPTDVQTVVITHGHADHVGGLVTDDGVPVFAEARHVIHTAELAFWRSAEAGGLPGGAGEPARVAFGALRAAGLLDETEGTTSVTPGVDAIEAPGHTPGHLAVVVGGAVLWAGDAIVATLNVTHPEWASAADMDPRTGEATRRALLGRTADDGWVLAASHLPEMGRVRRRGDGYAFETVG